MPEGKAVPFTDMISRCPVFLWFNKTEQKWQETLPWLFPVMFFLHLVDWTSHGAGHSVMVPDTGSQQKRESANACSELAIREKLKTA